MGMTYHGLRMQTSERLWIGASIYFLRISSAGEMYKSVGCGLCCLAHVARSQLTFQLRKPLTGRAIRCLSSGTDYTTILMPSLSPTMESGVIGAWIKQPGDTLAPGDVLCEIETDKASVGFEMQDDGVLAQILQKEQSGELKVGTPIALMVEDLAAFEKFKQVDPASITGAAAPAASPASEPSQPQQPQQQQQQEQQAQPQQHTPASKYQLSPAAAHMVRSKSLDISRIPPTGRGGKIITKEDLVLALKSGTAKSAGSQAAAQATAAQPQPQQQQQQRQQQPQASMDTTAVNERYTDVSNSSMRKTIAKRLTQSKTGVPHFYTAVEVEIDGLLAFRKQLQKDMDVNVSVNDMVIKSAALALRDVPEVNAHWDSNSADVAYSNGVDVSVAVATPNGLITPILRDAAGKGLSTINATVKELATRARDGKLKPEEYQGGSFSISNLGMFGIDEFTAVINPPQACILAVGRGAPRVLPPADGKGKPRVATIVTATLSADRRVVDNALASQFLQAFRHYLANPKALVL